MKDLIKKYNLVSVHVGGGLEHWMYQDEKNNRTYSICSVPRDCPDLDTYTKDELCVFTYWYPMYVDVENQEILVDNFLGNWSMKDDYGEGKGYESFEDTFENGLKTITDVFL